MHERPQRESQRQSLRSFVQSSSAWYRSVSLSIIVILLGERGSKPIRKLLLKGTILFESPLIEIRDLYMLCWVIICYIFLYMGLVIIYILSSNWYLIVIAIIISSSVSTWVISFIASPYLTFSYTDHPSFPHSILISVKESWKYIK